MAIIRDIGVSAYYDYQQIRKGLLNRIRGFLRQEIEIIPLNIKEEKQKKKGEKKYSDKELLKRWNELVNKNKISIEEYGYILKLWELGLDSLKLENKYKNTMKFFLKNDPIYNGFLKKIKGIAEIFSANLIKALGDCRVKIYRRIEIEGEKRYELIAQENDAHFNEEYENWQKDKLLPEKQRNYKKKGFENVSKLWAYFGLNVINGKAPRCRKGQVSNFNRKLRALLWNITTSFVKHNKGLYRNIYDNEKKKYAKRTYEKGELKNKYGKPYNEDSIKLTKKHMHNIAMRRTGKVFLDHYWHFARSINGLKAKKNYVEGVLNHKHIYTWQDALDLEMNV